MRTLILFFLIVTGTAVKAQVVYKTPSGHKYHLANCRMVKNASAKIDLADALAEGLGPCLICKPATVAASQPLKSTSGESTTSQCKGFTKAGTRCRHRTSIGNGYCYQHQPKNR